MALKWPAKDPNAKKDFGLDWSDFLTTGETITLSTWEVPTGLTKHDDSISSAVCLVWISGGTAGQNYTITNSITTSGGRIDERSITLPVKEQ